MKADDVSVADDVASVIALRPLIGRGMTGLGGPVFRAHCENQFQPRAGKGAGLSFKSLVACAAGIPSLEYPAS